MGEDTSAIVLRGVAKRFGYLTALQGIDLDVPVGVTLALFGPNGAGKTTLLRLISTLGKPTSGRIAILNTDTLNAPEQVRSQIGLISHQTLLYEDLTARENLVFYGRMYGLKDTADCARTSLDAVGLLDRAHDRVRTFSRGMKQRLAIARATLHRPSILLLDEPFTGLDVSARTLLSRMLEGLRQEGRTIVLVTHDLQQGLSLSDRFVILNRGRIVAQGISADVTYGDLETLYEAAIQKGR